MEFDKITAQYINLFEQQIIDVDELRKRVMKYGIPDNNKLRAKIWKLLLRYYSPHQNTWIETDQSYLKLYRKQKTLYCDNLILTVADQENLMKQKQNEMKETNENEEKEKQLENSKETENEIVEIKEQNEKKEDDDLIDLNEPDEEEIIRQKQLADEAMKRKKKELEMQEEEIVTLDLNGNEITSTSSEVQQHVRLQPNYPSPLSHELDESNETKELNQSKETPREFTQEEIINHSESIDNTLQFDRGTTNPENVNRFKNSKLAKIIDKDLERTNDSDKVNKERYNNSLRRILNILSNMPGGIPYVQGLNVIANVFYHVFIDASDAVSEELAEASTFYCMNNLLVNIKDWFDASKDMTPTGIRAAMGRVMFCVRQKNQRLADKLNEMIEPTFYLFRWLTLLGALELPMNVTILMWDRMFVEIRGMRYLIAFLAAMILEVECLINKFESSLKLLQHYPIKDFDRIHLTAQIVLTDVMRVNPAKIDMNEKPIGCAQALGNTQNKSSQKSQSNAFGNAGAKISAALNNSPLSSVVKFFKGGKK